MAHMADMIQKLNGDFKQASSSVIMTMVNMVGVEHDPSENITTLVEKLKEKGYVLRISRQNKEDVAVGNAIVLRDLDGNFVQGYNVWIDFLDDYTLKFKSLATEEEIGDYLNASNGLVN